ARHVVLGRAPLRVHAGSLTDVVRRAASSTGAGPAARPASARQGTNALVDTPMAPCYGWQESRFGRSTRHERSFFMHRVTLMVHMPPRPVRPFRWSFEEDRLETQG